MAVPSSGSLSLRRIAAEKVFDNYNITLDGFAQGTLGTTSLTDVSTSGNSNGSTPSFDATNTNSSSYPNGTTPHSMSEFYSYDHDASSSPSLTSFASSGIALSSPANVCNQSTFYTFYHDGSGVLPTTGDTVYTSSSGGSSNYLGSGYYRATHPSDDSFYQIGTNGTVISWGSCIP